MRKSNLSDGDVEASSSSSPLGIELGLITASAPEAHDKAFKTGAVSVKEAGYKAWIQTVS